LEDGEKNARDGAEAEDERPLRDVELPPPPSPRNVPRLGVVFADTTLNLESDLGGVLNPILTFTSEFAGLDCEDPPLDLLPPPNQLILFGGVVIPSAKALA